MFNKFNKLFLTNYCLVAPTDPGIHGVCSLIHFHFFFQFSYQGKLLMDLLITRISYFASFVSTKASVQRDMQCLIPI